MSPTATQPLDEVRLRALARHIGLTPVTSQPNIAAADWLAALTHLDIPLDTTLAEPANPVNWLPPVIVCRESNLPVAIPLTIANTSESQPIHWSFHEENGPTHHNVLQLNTLAEITSADGTPQRLFTLPIRPGTGYHRFELSTVIHGQPAIAQATVIVAPNRCFLPAGLLTQDHPPRIWGPIVKLAHLTSEKDWGVGDYGDLNRLIGWSADTGGNFIGIQDLCSKRPNSAELASSRLWRDPVYLEIERIPDFAESDEARTLALSENYQADIQAARALPTPDTARVRELKLHVLDKLYQSFRSRHLEPNTIRAQDFLRFVEEGGDRLQQFSVFEALSERLLADTHDTQATWRQWPEIYRSPVSPAVAEFVTANYERVLFQQYLQWLHHSQLRDAGSLCWMRGLTLGMLMSLSPQLDPDGADAWAAGNDAAVKTAHNPFIEMLRERMRFAGALQLRSMTQWIGEPFQPEGSEISFRAGIAPDDLLGILALESQRNKTVIIADISASSLVTAEMVSAWQILPLVRYLENRDVENGFQKPDNVAHLTALTVGSSLVDFWASLQEDEATSPDKPRDVKTLVLDRFHLLSALDEANLLPENITVDPASVKVWDPSLSQAVYTLLSKSPSLLLLINLEDFTGNTVTTARIPVDSADTSPAFAQLAESLRQERGLTSGLGEKKILVDLPTPKKTDIPSATYRFQFNKTFTFRDALALVPYLYRLGVTHCYASPLLKARAGSMHGYDIIDHAVLNPEIGTDEDFHALTDALHAHGMGLVVDIVPNHMGVGSDNAWWMDVLENGPVSEYADTFDIDWSPVKDELYAKVLLPILGNQYGKVLKDGEFEIRFNLETGRFSLHYYDHFWPINPNSYAAILRHRTEVLALRLGPEDLSYMEYLSIADGFEQLPRQHYLQDDDSVAIRRREKRVQLRRLVDLCADNVTICDFIQENLLDFNGVKDNILNRQRMHALLEDQAYRLAYWRVASDEINYRRFFDVNDLAGLNMEQPRVFWNTHRRILDEIKAGRIQGLRIDHPDGLYDPAGYFKMLQEAVYQTKGAPGAPDLAEPAQFPLYVVVEKILGAGEKLPDNWPVHGTTGYEFANNLNALFVDPGNNIPMTEAYSGFINVVPNFRDLVYTCKKLIMYESLSSELTVLANQLNRLSERDWDTRDFTLNNLRRAIAEVVACFPVYRTYITADSELTDSDSAHITRAIQSAKRRMPLIEPTIFDFIRDILTRQEPVDHDDAYAMDARRFAMKFQQYSGPVMAKGLEDTCFYRYNRLASLNEVGGEPQHFGTSVEVFHRENQERLSEEPYTMLNTSTHDSKRSEDLRVRVDVLSEIPERWGDNVRSWSRIARPLKMEGEDILYPDANEEYLIYQTLLGVWPLAGAGDTDLETLCDRLEAYLLKAAREAKVHTSWINQNTQYEEALTRFLRGLLLGDVSEKFLTAFQPLQQDIAFWGKLNALSQVALKLTVPGVPDLYQGTELWDFSLVDPDNRRPQDYDLRKTLLEQYSPMLADNVAPSDAWLKTLADLLEDDPIGELKLLVTTICLGIRQRYGRPFLDADYIPVEATGAKADHVVAFARVVEGRHLMVVVPRLIAGLTAGQPRLPLGQAVWEDTCLNNSLPLRRTALRNLITRETVDAREANLPVAQLLNHFPIGLFEEIR